MFYLCISRLTAITLLFVSFSNAANANACKNLLESGGDKSGVWASRFPELTSLIEEHIPQNLIESNGDIVFTEQLPAFDGLSEEFLVESFKGLIARLKDSNDSQNLNSLFMAIMLTGEILSRNGYVSKIRLNNTLSNDSFELVILGAQDRRKRFHRIIQNLSDKHQITVLVNPLSLTSGTSYASRSAAYVHISAFRLLDSLKGMMDYGLPTLLHEVQHISHMKKEHSKFLSNLQIYPGQSLNGLVNEVYSKGFGLTELAAWSSDIVRAKNFFTSFFEMNSQTSENRIEFNSSHFTALFQATERALSMVETELASPASLLRFKVYDNGMAGVYSSQMGGIAREFLSGFDASLTDDEKRSLFMEDLEKLKVFLISRIRYLETFDTD